MEVTINDISEVQKEIHISTTAEELTPHFEQAYKDYSPKVEIDGFRKGKAPAALVRRLYGEQIEYNALETIASNLYREIIESRKIDPIGEPVLTNIDYKRGEKLTFSVKYEIKPSVELKEFTGIEIEKLVHPVTDAEIDQELLRIRKANHTLENADKAVDTEFVVTSDIQQLDDSGNPLIGKKTVDAKFYLGDEQLLPEIREALVNSAPGDKRRVTTTHEHEDHKHTDLMELTVKTVERVVLPELNDDLVSKVTKGKIATVPEFRTHLRTELEAYWKERSDRRLEDTMISEIVRRHEINVPESLVKGVLDSLVEDLKNRYPGKKLPADFNEASFREGNHGYGVYQAKWFLIREQILKAQKITVEPADIEKLAETDAPKVGIDKEHLLQFYKTSEHVTSRIESEKLMEWLRGQQKITEKITDEQFQ
jgi:trigger factor